MASSVTSVVSVPLPSATPMLTAIKQNNVLLPIELACREDIDETPTSAQHSTALLGPPDYEASEELEELEDETPAVVHGETEFERQTDLFRQLFEHPFDR